MAWNYTPDPVPPQFGQQFGQPQIVYVPQPVPPVVPGGKKGKKASLKSMFKARQEIDELIKAVEEAKKKDKKEEPKKRSGLTWIELTLLLVFVSIPIASIELIAAVMLAKMLPFK